MITLSAKVITFSADLKESDIELSHPLIGKVSIEVRYDYLSRELLEFRIAYKKQNLIQKHLFALLSQGTLKALCKDIHIESIDRASDLIRIQSTLFCNKVLKLLNEKTKELQVINKSFTAQSDIHSEIENSYSCGRFLYFSDDFIKYKLETTHLFKETSLYDNQPSSNCVLINYIDNSNKQHWIAVRPIHLYTKANAFGKEARYLYVYDLLSESKRTIQVSQIYNCIPILEVMDYYNEGEVFLKDYRFTLQHKCNPEKKHLDYLAS